MGRSESRPRGEENTSLLPGTLGRSSMRILLTITPTSSQLDPGPGATVGGMIATGCSGSQ